MTAPALQSFSQTIRYGDADIRYAVRRTPGRDKSIRIHVNPNGVVEVEAPEEANLQSIREAVRLRAQWILSHQREISLRRSHVLPREYISGESHFYLGRRYVLKVLPVDGASGEKGASRQGVKLSGAYLVVRLSAPQLLRLENTVEEHTANTWTTPLSAQDKLQTARRKKVKSLLRDWYREHAQAYLAKRLGLLSKDVSWVGKAPQCRLQVMRRQWGSCSPGGVLLLNPHLIKAPARCIDYVLLHELCHLREHNHSKAFYALLGNLMPDWKPVKDKLDNMAEALLNE
ncbi:M48 family metallopeptidase [Desulfovibrio sp. OttesenSCG-928-A18]|nr:M48 family metallopeptidase [Desulfovibrio sp. OttesenSCG-928-A18]